MRIKQVLLIPLLLISLHLMVISASGSTVRGYIGLSGQSDSAGIVVSIGIPSDSDTIHSTMCTVFTNEAGSYSFENIPADIYIITASLHGYKNKSSEMFRVYGGTIAEITPFILEPDTGLMHGYVLLEDADSGNDDGILVTLRDTPFAVLTDSGGRYDFNHVPVGQYTVVASKEGYLEATYSDATVKANRDVRAGNMILMPEENSMIYIKDSVDDIKNQLSSFQYEQDELFNNFDDLHNLVAQQKSEIDVLKLGIEGVTTKVNSIEDNVINIDSRIQVLEENDEIDQLSGTIDMLVEKTLSIEEDVQNLEDKVSIIINILKKKYKKEFEAALID